MEWMSAVRRRSNRAVGGDGGPGVAHARRPSRSSGWYQLPRSRHTVSTRSADACDAPSARAFQGTEAAASRTRPPRCARWNGSCAGRPRSVRRRRAAPHGAPSRSVPRAQRFGLTHETC